MEETLRVFVLGLIEPLCAQASLQQTTYTPVSKEETADEFV